MREELPAASTMAEIMELLLRTAPLRVVDRRAGGWPRPHRPPSFNPSRESTAVTARTYALGALAACRTNKGFRRLFRQWPF